MSDNEYKPGYIPQNSPIRDSYERMHERGRIVDLGQVVLMALLAVMVMVMIYTGFNPFTFAMNLLSSVGPMPWQFDSVIDWLVYIL